MIGPRPRLQVVNGMRGPNSDPRLAIPIWNREWTPGEHRGFAFSTETARVDVVDPQPTRHPRIFAGGSRTIDDRELIDAKLKALPRCAVILTSRTHGASPHGGVDGKDRSPPHRRGRVLRARRGDDQLGGPGSRLLGRRERRHGA